MLMTDASTRESSVKQATRVAISECSSYQDSRRALEEIFSSLGVRGLFKSGDRVLVKPNLLSARPPEEAVTTHPAVVDAVLSILIDSGVRPVLGDSPASGKTVNVARVAGVESVCKKYGVRIVTFDEGVPVKTDKGIYRRFIVAREVLEADSIINLPKLKTHSQMTMTLAIKNTFGCIVGSEKQKWHFRARDRNAFADMLIDLHNIIDPSLNILDGVVGMDGNGPSNGRIISPGLIAASTSGFALDDHIIRTVGVNPRVVPTALRAIQRNLIPSYEVMGDTYAYSQRFTLPATAPLTFVPFVRFLRRFTTRFPAISESKCTRCRTCEKHCPVNAISIDDGTIDYRKCITCYVCQEICPYDAITYKRSIFSKRRKAR
ncbi:MAG: Uncharacterized protein XE05_0166 [Thermotogales bacterium 46_20]|nr:MAG: Uncharacterized protein XE05_0166 [Thermotogales bacterium 46_20]